MRLSTDPWQSLPLGAHLRRQTDSLLRARLPQLFGYHLLALGDYASHLNWQTARTRQVWTMASSSGDVRLLPEALPIAADSVDVVVLPLTLDFSDSPHDVLREAARVLVGDGHLVIIGFNPHSSWYARKWLTRRDRPLRQARFIAPGRMRDWLRLLGFEVQNQSFAEYRMPIGSVRWLRRFEWLDHWAKRRQLPFGALYIMVAQKRVLPLTLSRLRKRRLLPLDLMPVSKPLPRSEILTAVHHDKHDDC